MPTARTASATPPDTHGAALAAPAQAQAQSPTASKPTTQDDATDVVQKRLIRPLAQKEAGRNRLSRSYIPPQARRVRIPDGQRSTDGRGAEFVAFAVDERSGRLAFRDGDDSRGWREDVIVGCVYPAKDEIFIKRGDKFFAAGLLLGQKTSADDTVCRPAPTRVPPGSPTLASKS